MPSVMGGKTIEMVVPSSPPPLPPKTIFKMEPPPPLPPPPMSSVSGNKTTGADRPSPTPPPPSMLQVPSGKLQYYHAILKRKFCNYGFKTITKSFLRIILYYS